MRLFIDLTPFIPLSFEGEGELVIEERVFTPQNNVFAGAPYSPLFDSPLVWDGKQGCLTGASAPPLK